MTVVEARIGPAAGPQPATPAETRKKIVLAVLGGRAPLHCSRSSCRRS